MTFLRRFSVAVAVLALGLGLVACGGDDEPAAAAGSTPEASSEPLQIGYSAWPGWFPLKVAEEKGFFAEEGVNVKLRFFSDYIASIDALNAGQVDANTQTLNDTLPGVSTGVKLKVVVNTDFSAGNDAIIVDKSINSIEDLKGKTVAAEAGVVDHFLLLQGLASKGLTEKDVDFRGVLTDAAAAGFASGQFDAVGVFAPFTLEALKRPGSKVLFSSKDFPGSISDHIVFGADVVASRPDDVQKVVNAWYKTVAFLNENPEEARAIMAKQAGITPEEYAELDAGTQILTAEDAAAAFEAADLPTSLPTTAKKLNPFLVESGLIREPADLTGIFAPEFTQAYLDAAGE
jgi:NitT/TauT family transport system substrate-binding protein